VGVPLHALRRLRPFRAAFRRGLSLPCHFSIRPQRAGSESVHPRQGNLRRAPRPPSSPVNVDLFDERVFQWRKPFTTDHSRRDQAPVQHGHSLPESIFQQENLLPAPRRFQTDYLRKEQTSCRMNVNKTSFTIHLERIQRSASTSAPLAP
jgi:hypothetical protein